MILTLGIATNRLYRDDSEPEDPSQPYLVDAAFDLSDLNGVSLGFIKRAVRLPAGSSVQAGAEKAHGISLRRAKREGANQRWFCFGVLEAANESQYIVSYGTMARKVIASIILRVAGKDADQWIAQWERPGLQWIDLQSACSMVCRLPHSSDKGGYRWPSRAEAAAAILDPGELASLATEERFGAAWANCMTDKAIYLALRQRQILEEAA